MLPLRSDEPPPILGQITILHKQKKRKKMDAVGIEPTTIHMLIVRSEYHTLEALLVDVAVMLLLRHL